jgi:hypothetical protein
VFVRGSARDLRRSLRPVVWVVLEELALHAVAVDGVLVAPTSARSIAQELGLDPGTAASALRTLRDRGLVDLAHEPRSCGRFGLLFYRLSPIAGIEVVGLCGDSPHAVEPCSVEAHTDTDGEMTGCRVATRRSRSAGDGGRQGVLDLGSDTR